ncbi:MAG TPA: RagB/SusD family nutrient uptake outer membrane protein, partial [Sphingobacterium sp.]|nr:RagB/SusD family nutrient uptake outer membrane protein [Sphingobacterium sp.]
MNNTKKYYKILILSFITLLTVGCTDLEENLYSSLNKDNFYNSKLEVRQAVLRPFTHMQAWLAPTGQNGYYYHSELSSDQLAWPQKGKHGYDGGDHFRQHYHTWTANEGRMRDAWDLMWGGVGFINSLLSDLDEINIEEIDLSEEELTSMIAQSKVLRGFHYLKIMDLWGNVPIVTEVGEPRNPETRSRKEVFEFVKNELEENVDQLPLTAAENIGEVNMAAGYAMLAELYLNAEKWTGEPMWDECIEACDKIISGEAGGIGGAPKLSPDLNSLFSNTNSANPESLFQFQFSRKAGFTFDWGGFFMGYDYMKDALKVGYGGWNAFVVIPTAFDAYQENDLRKEEWFLFGPQYEYGTDEPVLGTEEWNKKPLEFVNSIRRESEG